MCLTRPAAAFEQQPRHFGIAFYRRAEPLAQIDRWLSRRCLPERREAARPEPLTNAAHAHELCDAFLLLLRLVLGTERDAGEKLIVIATVREVLTVVSAFMTGVHGIGATRTECVMLLFDTLRLHRLKKLRIRTNLFR